MIHCAPRRPATALHTRHTASMRPVREAIPSVLAHIVREQPPSQARLDFAWRTVAGPAMARATRVEQDARGTVRVHAPDPNWRREVRRALPELRARLAALLGDGVSRLTLSK